MYKIKHLSIWTLLLEFYDYIPTSLVITGKTFDEQSQFHMEMSFQISIGMMELMKQP